MKRIAFLLVFAILFSLATLGQDDAQHHEDLAPEQLGTVHFPISCVVQVQQRFERGVALLHSFWYEEAEKQFEQVAAADPHCAIAHWGIAMSYWHELWNRPDAKTIKKGRAEADKALSLHTTDDRERGYIAAIDAFYGGPNARPYHARAEAYARAMGKLAQDHPEDLEASTFYALSLLASRPDNDTTFANEKKAAAILQKLFAVEPNHPGVAHYLIHSCDSPQMAPMALAAARRYAQIAPAAPHALHMPSHIFARLGLWQDDINSNLASIAATRKAAAEHKGGEGHQYHAMDFLQYAYLQSGREADAQHLIEEVRAMPEMNDNMYGDFDPHMYALVVFPARYDLEMHHWADAASLAPEPDARIGDRSVTYWARAIGSARSGHPDQARLDILQITTIRKTLVHQKKKGMAEGVQQDLQEATAWISHAEGKNDIALKLLRTVAQQQEAEAAEPLAIPAREMLADMLLDMNRPDQALTEYESDLKYNPNRFDGLYGAAHAAELAGKSDKANTYYAELVKVCAGSGSERPELSHAKALLAQK